jgi:hypothetical protein
MSPPFSAADEMVEAGNKKESFWKATSTSSEEAIEVCKFADELWENS